MAKPERPNSGESHCIEDFPARSSEHPSDQISFADNTIDKLNTTEPHRIDKPCERRQQSPRKWLLLIPCVFHPCETPARNWHRLAASSRSSGV